MSRSRTFHRHEQAPVRRLSALAAGVHHTALVGDAVVTGITEDSRSVRPGWLFVARRGGRTDGHRYLLDAVRRGAAAVVVERPTSLGVPQLVVANATATVGPLAARFYGYPSRQLLLAGVTGTNGKTTTCDLVRACLERTGRPAGQIGTIATRVGQQSQPSSMTTPAPTELHEHLWEMVQAGVGAVAMEVSSHALDQHRVDGIEFDVAVFTNLDTEHLDYHGTMEQYWASKARLFEPERCEQAVVCVDGPWGARLAYQAQVPVTTFAQHTGADVRYHVEDRQLAGSVVHLQGPDGELTIPSHMVGTVNGANVTAAYLAARALGVDPPTAVEALAACPAPPGRFQLVDAGQPFLVVVDYAHTPDALASLISTARRCAGPGGQVRVVVGARGGRDRLKRPRTGAVAASAGWTVLTTDSPGVEDPWSIIQQLRLGTMEVPDAEVLVEPDRRRAITMAIDAAGPGDVILIVGRGHEQVQHVNGAAIPLDDRQVAHAALTSRFGSGTRGAHHAPSAAMQAAGGHPPAAGPSGRATRPSGSAPAPVGP